MNKYIRYFIIGLILIFSYTALSACVSHRYPNLSELSDNHYLNNPHINDIEPEDIPYDNNQDNENNQQHDGEHSSNDNTNSNTSNSNDIEENIRIDKNLIEGKDTLLKALTHVNIRSKPSTNSQIVGTIIAGAMLPYVSEANGCWYETIYKSKEAFVSKQYFQLAYFNKGDSLIEQIIGEAKLLLGYPYIYGAQRYHWGNGNLNTNFVMGQFDCSSLTQYAFYKGAGINIDLTTRTQVYQGAKVNEKNNLKRGDLMFFTNASRRYLTGTERIGHVAIYLGDNYILHTASTYAIIEPISTRRWNDYITARRFL